MIEETEIIEENEAATGGFGLGSIVLMLSVIVAAAMVGVALFRQNEGRPLEGPAPNFEFTTFDGETYQLSDFRGQVVMLNFWASWCVPCIAEAPEFQSAWEKYQDQGVVFIGIAYADNGPNALAFLERFGITYLNAPDIGTRITDMYSATGIPETFIIDQNGDVAEFIYAGTTEKTLSEIIDRLLAGDSS
jgi:cytochrome c biogenesis protein CcmG, thiol:disulfide interchange protein DsbE